MAVISGAQIVFGIPSEMLPLHGFPSGKIRLKFRNDEFALAYVRTKDGITCYCLKEEDGYFMPYAAIAANRAVHHLEIKISPITKTRIRRIER